MSNENNGTKLSLPQRVMVWSYSDHFMWVVTVVIVLVALGVWRHDDIGGLCSYLTDSVVERGMTAWIDLTEWWGDRWAEAQQNR